MPALIVDIAVLYDNILSVENDISTSQKYDSELDIMMSSISTSISPNTFRDTVNSSVIIDLPMEVNRGHQVKNIASSQMNDRHHIVTPKSLA